MGLWTSNYLELPRFLLFWTIAAPAMAGRILLAVGLAASASAQEPMRVQDPGATVVIHV